MIKVYLIFKLRLKKFLKVLYLPQEEHPIYQNKKMMTFIVFVKKYKLKDKATSIIKIYQVLDSIGLNNVGIYLRDGPFSRDIGTFNLHPSEGSHWVCYINENYFDSFGCVCPNKLSKFTIKRHCLYSEYQIQKNDRLCARYCLYIIYFVKVLGIDFKSAVLNL